MKLKIVTVTGADDSVDVAELVNIAQDYPFVEFGILLSRSNRGSARFPSKQWLARYYNECVHRYMPKSCAHLCGAWVRDLCFGGTQFINEIAIFDFFDRVQLNFHALSHPVLEPEFYDVLHVSKKQYIFQMDNVNDKLMYTAIDRNINAVPLFDASGGEGVLPKKWPRQDDGIYSGYAGGLSPENVEEQIKRIQDVADGDIWIDAETYLRSEDDKVFDLKKVVKFLKRAGKYVSYN